MSQSTFRASKAAGLAAFSSCNWQAAKASYLEASTTVGASTTDTSICLCNAAACCLKLAEFEEAERLAGEALDANPGYVKALYRRAQARAAQGRGPAALADLDKLLSLEPANSAATALARSVVSGKAAAAGAAARISSDETIRMGPESVALAAVTCQDSAEGKAEVALQHLCAAPSQSDFKSIAPIVAGTLQHPSAAVSFAFSNGVSALITAEKAEPFSAAGLLRLLLKGAGASARSRLHLLQGLAKASVAAAWFKRIGHGSTASDWTAAGVGLYGSVMHFYAHGDGSSAGQTAALAAASGTSKGPMQAGSDPEVDALLSLRRFSIPAFAAVLKSSHAQRTRLAALEGLTAALASPSEAEVLLATGTLRSLVAATAAVDSMGEAAEASPGGGASEVTPESIPRAAQSTLATLLQHLRRSIGQSSDAIQERVRGMLLAQCQHALRSMPGTEGVQGGSAWDLAQEEEKDELVKQAVAQDQKNHERAERRRMAQAKREEKGVDGGATGSKSQDSDALVADADAADASTAGTGADPRVAELRDREESRAAALQAVSSAAARDPSRRVDPLEAERALKLMHTAFLTHPDATLSLLQRASFRTLLLAAGQSARTPTQVAMADLVSVVVGDKEGGGEAIVSQGLLALLGELAASRTLSLRSAATVALAKLTSGSMVSKPGVGLNGLPAGGAASAGGDSDSAAQAEATAAQGKAKREALASVYLATAGLLDSAALLLPQLAASDAPAADSSLGGVGSAAGATTMAGAGVVVARAVESLSVIIGHTSVKHAIMQDQGTLRALMHLLHALGHGVAVPPSRAKALGALAPSKQASSKAGMSMATHFAALCGGSPTLLGAAYILYALVTSVDEQRTAALAQMELDPETWEKFQQLTSSGGGGVDEADPTEAVQARVQALVSMEGTVQDASCAAADVATGAGGIGGPDRTSCPLTIVGVLQGIHSMVEHLATAAGAGKQEASPGAKAPGAMAGRSIMVNELLARCSLGLTAPQNKTLRGRLVQLGTLSLLQNLTEAKKNTITGRVQSAQALARVLISTNPGLLPEAQLHDCIAPLVMLARVLDAAPPSMAKKGASAGAAQGTSFDAHTGSVSLQRFEACLALTNLASHGATTQRILIAAGALSALESLQFDRNALVRRAATEGITNLATTDAGRAVITKRSLSLWCALASSYWEDEVTAIAAAGGLAMATAMQYDLSEREVKSEGVRWVGTAQDAAESETALLDQGRVAAQAVLAGDGVKAMCSALLSGISDLQHRALVVLRNLLYVPGAAEALSRSVSIDVSFAHGADEAEDSSEESKQDAAVASKEPTGQSEVEVVPVALLAAMVQGADLPSWNELQREEQAGSAAPKGTKQTTSPVLQQLASTICDTVKSQLLEPGSPAGYAEVPSSS